MMSEEKFIKMRNSLRMSMKEFPNCTIAACKCDSKNGERIDNCHCMCHLDEEYPALKVKQ